jgi:hypothetical protein
MVCALLTFVLGGCRNGEKAVGDSATQTIEPAKPQPDTDTVSLTQTVDVEKGRSEVEGRNASGADITTSEATTTTVTTTTAPPPPPTTTTR